VWALDVDLVRCAEVRDVVSADVVAEPFEAATIAAVAFVDESVNLVEDDLALGGGEPG
jgi:hypothetical protein